MSKKKKYLKMTEKERIEPSDIAMTFKEYGIKKGAKKLFDTEKTIAKEITNNLENCNLDKIGNKIHNFITLDKSINAMFEKDDALNRVFSSKLSQEKKEEIRRRENLSKNEKTKFGFNKEDYNELKNIRKEVYEKIRTKFNKIDNCFK